MSREKIQQKGVDRLGGMRMEVAVLHSFWRCSTVSGRMRMAVCDEFVKNSVAQRSCFGLRGAKVLLQEMSRRMRLDQKYEVVERFFATKPVRFGLSTNGEMEER